MHKVIVVKEQRVHIDLHDVHLLREHQWNVYDINGYRYVARQDRGKTVYLHRIIAGAVLRSEIVDHRNRNTLDNRRSNLRITTTRINALNTPQRRWPPTIAQHKGVWRARVTLADGRHEKSSKDYDVVEAWVAQMHVQQVLEADT